MHFRYVHHLLQLDSEVYDKASISQNTLCAKVAEGAKNTVGNYPTSLPDRDQHQNPAAPRDRKQVQQEGQDELFPTMLQQTGQVRDHLLLSPYLITSALS